ncbi:hypothetical protein Aduo_001399 [Ancylostoma duodenale]
MEKQMKTCGATKVGERTELKFLENLSENLKKLDGIEKRGEEQKQISLIGGSTFPAGDIPKRACAAQDGLSNDLQDIAVDMHNYYRRLVATGWDPTNDGYAPRAKAMLGLNYECGDPAVQNNIGSATKKLVEGCPKNAPQATGAHSLNHYYENTYKLSPEELLEKAITKWADEVSKVGEGNIYKKDLGFNNFANMMRDESDQITCAVNVCQKSGGSAVVCQYNNPPVEDDPIYQMGAPCKPCPTGTACDDKLGGLCVKPQP